MPWSATASNISGKSVTSAMRFIRSPLAAGPWKSRRGLSFLVEIRIPVHQDRARGHVHLDNVVIDKGDQPFQPVVAGGIALHHHHVAGAGVEKTVDGAEQQR